MATIQDIASFNIIDPGTNGSSTPTTLAVVTAPSVTTLQIVTAGPQGPQGVQNVYVGATPPASPQVDWIWIQT